MTIPNNLIVNADDLGKDRLINEAIFKSFELGYINSSSLMVNTPYFLETVEEIKLNKIENIGVHIDLVDGKPMTHFKHMAFLKDDGSWASDKYWNLNIFFSKYQKAFEEEIVFQIERMKRELFTPKHINSHHHIHTLPGLFPVFLKVAKMYNIQLRLAQSYNEGNLVKHGYRKILNSIIKQSNLDFSTQFETIPSLINRTKIHKNDLIEIMVHPGYDQFHNLIDTWEKTDFHEDIKTLSKHAQLGIIFN